MKTISNLTLIKTDWLAEAERQLAKSKQIRQSVHASLDRFFDLLTTAVESGEPHVLDPILDEWARWGMRVEMKPEQTSVVSLLERLLLTTVEMARCKLEEGEALALISETLPVYTHAFFHTSQCEMQLQREHLAAELEEARNVLAQLDASKSAFISIAAHELKTPLTLIQGYNEMIREQLGPDLKEDTAELLRGIENGANRLEEIVNDMIDISLIDNNC